MSVLYHHSDLTYHLDKWFPLGLETVFHEVWKQTIYRFRLLSIRENILFPASACPRLCSPKKTNRVIVLEPCYRIFEWGGWQSRSVVRVCVPHQCRERSVHRAARMAKKGKISLLEAWLRNRGAYLKRAEKLKLWLKHL